MFGPAVFGPAGFGPEPFGVALWVAAARRPIGRRGSELRGDR